MATTSLWRIKGASGDVIRYAENEKKTTKEILPEEKAREQVVRTSLNGVEIAAKLTGKAAERLAVLIYSIIKDNKKTKGKSRLKSILRTGKELSIFSIKDRDMEKFSKEAKRYGILYCVLKDRNANDGLTDIMVRESDAGKLSRMLTRYGLYDFSEANG